MAMAVRRRLSSAVIDKMFSSNYIAGGQKSNNVRSTVSECIFPMPGKCI